MSTKAPKKPTAPVEVLAMQVSWWKTSKPIPYARNARKIPQAAIDKVAASIREYGWQQAIVVDEEGVILAGHTRLLAAQKLELEQVPVKVATGLTKQQAKAFRLADNRSATEAKWDFELLALELSELQELGADLELTAFDSHEIEPLLAADWSPEAASEDFEEEHQRDSPPPADGDEPENKSLDLTVEQYELVQSAIGTLRVRENNPHISEGRALELICGSYLVLEDKPVDLQEAEGA